MTIWTRDELVAQLAEWKKALLLCASGKSYGIAGRTLTRSDVADIRKTLSYLERKLNKIDGAPVGPVFVQGVTRRG